DHVLPNFFPFGCAIDLSKSGHSITPFRQQNKRLDIVATLSICRSVLPTASYHSHQSVAILLVCMLRHPDLYICANVHISFSPVIFFVKQKPSPQRTGFKMPASDATAGMTMGV